MVGKATADSHRQHDDSTATVEVADGSASLRAASTEPKEPPGPTEPMAPVVPAAPVPTTRSLRMLLGVLKHNPAGAIREVGVLLMLHASSIEVVKASATLPVVSAAASSSPSSTPSCSSSSAQIPSGVLSGKSGGGGGRGGKGWCQPRTTKKREESARLKRRTEEAEAVLTLALATEKKTTDDGTRLAPGGATAAPPTTTTTNNKTRFQHQLRQPAKVEDRLQAWAATRGREVAGLRELLGLSTTGGGLSVRPRPADIQLVLNRVSRISAGSVRKVHRCRGYSSGDRPGGCGDFLSTGSSLIV